MAENKFLGIRQYTREGFNALSNSDKIHHINFVRDIDESGETISTEIYFGTRLYANDGGGDIRRINQILQEAGIVDESGQTVNIIELIEENQLGEGEGITIVDKKIYANTESQTVSDIVVAGGPINAENIWEDNIIPSGTSVQEILEKLLCKELFPNAATKPTITAKVSGTAISGLKEVNSTLTVNGFTSTTTAGKFNADYTNVTQPSTNSTWSNIKYTTTKTGFTNYSVSEDAEAIDAQTGITVSEGSNKVSVTVKGDYTAPTTTPLTNLNKPATADTYTYVAASANSTTYVTVTGVYPVYANGVSASTKDSVAAEMAALESPKQSETSVATEKLPLCNVKTEFAVSFAKHTLAPYRLLLPSGYSITSALAIDGLKGTYTIDIKSKFVKTEETETKKSGGVDTTYCLWEYAGTEGANRVKFIINKD